ncbi:hypothetical protein PI126_g13515 [Phytophthora idaei]|nr:hypothetical protein PI126_g13515 [Phytophthora idaei]
MVQYFGDEKGLRNQDFGQSGVALPVFPRAPFDSDSGDEENRENEEDDSSPQAEDEEHKVGEEENEGELLGMTVCATSASWGFLKLWSRWESR